MVLLRKETYLPTEPGTSLSRNRRTPSRQLLRPPYPPFDFERQAFFTPNPPPIPELEKEANRVLAD